MLNAMQPLKSKDHFDMQQRRPCMLLFGQFLAEGNLQSTAGKWSGEELLKQDWKLRICPYQRLREHKQLTSEISSLPCVKPYTNWYNTT